MVPFKKSSILPGSFDHPHYFLPDKAIVANLVYMQVYTYRKAVFDEKLLKLEMSCQIVEKGCQIWNGLLPQLEMIPQVFTFFRLKARFLKLDHKEGVNVSENYFIKQGNYSLRRPQSLSYHKQWLGKDGLLYIQTYTSKQSYTARVQVDCAV